MSYSPDGSAPLIPPPPTPGPTTGARKPVKWGCIAAAAGLVAILGAVSLCCLLPGYRAWRMSDQLGMSGMMGVGWLANVAQGNMSQAGQITVGGEPAARKLVDTVKASIGDLTTIPPDFSGVTVREDDAAGTAEVSVPVSGSAGSGTCVLALKRQAQNVWFVESLRME